MQPDDGAWPAWPRADERGLARFVTARAGRWLALEVNRYDLGDQPDRCRRVVAAIYEALLDRDVRYALEAYHPSEALQQIRTPAEVLTAPREGTCLDLAALYCGLCLAYELLPVLVVVDGHAFVAVSTTHGLRDWNGYDRPGRELFADGPVTDAAALLELVDGGAYVAVECTGFARSDRLERMPDRPESRHRSGGVLTFEQAVTAGREQFDEPDRPLRFAVDVATAHFGWRIEPHPVEAVPDVPSVDIFGLLGRAPASLAEGLPVLAFERLVAERTRTFVGREFIFDAIDRLIADPAFPSGYVLIRGEPGIGKTSLSSQLVRTRGYVHHFNIALEGIRSPRAFLANVCAQLIVRYELNHPALPAEATTDSAFLSRLLAEAAQRSGEEPVVVVVDALDEAEDDGLSAAANRLYLPATLPDGVFLVLTSREQIDYRLDVSRREDLYLRDDDPRNLDDVRAYVTGYLDDHSDAGPRIAAWGVDHERFVDVVTEHSQGNFMYLVHVLDDIRTGRISAGTTASVDQLPVGLRAYYERHWRQMRDQEPARFTEVYEPVLRILATVREPVGVSAVEEWTELRRTDVRAVIRDWRQFLNETPATSGEPLYRVYHASFQDFLAEEGVGLRPYHERIAMTALAKVPGFLD